MRICLITYEYPPDTGIGGIATYMYELSKAFERKKIETEVICASPVISQTTIESNFLTITKVLTRSTEEFRTLLPTVAKKRYAEKPFDIIECPEFGAEGLYVKTILPHVPLVIKLHTPHFLIKELNDYYYDQLWWRKLKSSFGFGYSYKKDAEYKALLMADHVTSSSASLKDIIQDRWRIPEDKITIIPNPYFPSADLLNIAAGSESKTVLFAGRLETRKGVYNLARAIPKVIEKIPDARFIFLGKDSQGPYRERSMKKVLQKIAGKSLANIRFADQVPLNEMPSFLAQAHTCIFPSLWENFPNVCFMAMSSGRNIIGGMYGGMSDMLNDTGKEQLVDPHDINAIACSIIDSLQNNSPGRAAFQNRERVLNEYGDKIIDQTIQLYQSLL